MSVPEALTPCLSTRVASSVSCCCFSSGLLDQWLAWGSQLPPSPTHTDGPASPDLGFILMTNA